MVLNKHLMNYVTAARNKICFRLKLIDASHPRMDSACIVKTTHRRSVNRKWEYGKSLFATVFASFILTSCIFLLLYVRCIETHIDNCKQDTFHAKLSGSECRSNKTACKENAGKYKRGNMLSFDFSKDFSTPSKFTWTKKSVFTICTWYKLQTTASALFFYKESMSEFTLRLENKRIFIDRRTNEGERENIVSVVDEQLHKWRHLCISVNITTLTLVINDNRQQSFPIKNKCIFDEENVVSLHVGNSNLTQFSGEISQLYIYDRKLTNESLFWLNRFYSPKLAMILNWDEFSKLNSNKMSTFTI